MQIQVRINEEGALRNQRYAFTDKFTLISELMQNARRAGAEHINITYDAATEILRVIDDGCGIEDFQKLLTFNESGWDKETCRAEQPFGIGFSKCLYSASRCIVTSGNRQIDFNTKHALDRQPIDVVDIADHPHTAIQLHDVDLPAFQKSVESLCSGFPVRVWVNGKELARMHATDHLPFWSSDVGLVYLPGTGSGEYAHDTLVFLQGFCVYKPLWVSDTAVNIVHLDPTQFVARLPDRDKLIDEAEQINRIETCIRHVWRHVLEEAKSHMTGEAFVDLFYKAMRRFGHLDLANSIPCLPRSICKRIVGYPIVEGYEERDYVAPVDGFINRSEVESGSTILVDLDDVSITNAASWMFARAKGYIAISSASLPGDHWVQQHIRLIDDNDVHVEAKDETCRATFEGGWTWLETILCGSVSIVIGEDRAEVTHDGVYHMEKLFIPAGEQSGASLRQATSFIDENEQFQSDHCEADREALSELIRLLRSVDPKITLESLIQEMKLEKYPLLHGKTFQLTVSNDRGKHDVELID